MKSFDVKLNAYMGFDVEQNNDTHRKFKVVDHVRISKCKKIFAENFIPNWSEEESVIKKVEKAVTQTYTIKYLNGEEIIKMFYKKEFKRQIKQTLKQKE